MKMTMAQLIEVYRSVIGLLQLDPQEQVSFVLARRIEQMEVATKQYDADMVELRAEYDIPVKPSDDFEVPDGFEEAVKEVLGKDCGVEVKPIKWKLLEGLIDKNGKVMRVPGSIVAGLMPIIEGGPEDDPEL